MSITICKLTGKPVKEWKPVVLPTSNVPDIIADRAKTHGDWNKQSRLAHDLKRRIAQEQPELSPSQYEALEMICTKIARIVCGNPNEPDHWKDLSGYATLVLNELE